jgi:hypothetical protein
MRMTVHVDRTVTEVFSEPQSRPEGSDEGGDTRFERKDQLRALLAELRRFERRTCAEGFDD